ncbi:MAG TPA: hypothetical protein VF484_08005 [Candidatus Limnocylindrales bacterium]
MAFDEAAVRERAAAFGSSLAAGNVDAAIADFSDELRRNLGEVLGLLPLPVVDATIETVERGSSSFVVVVRLLGESQEDQIQTRWKDRDGSPRIVELSHLSRVAREPAPTTDEGETGAEPAAETGAA